MGVFTFLVIYSIKSAGGLKMSGAKFLVVGEVSAEMVTCLENCQQVNKTEVVFVGNKEEAKEIIDKKGDGITLVLYNGRNYSTAGFRDRFLLPKYKR